MYCFFLISRYEILRVCLILIIGVNNVDLLKFLWPQDHKEEPVNLLRGEPEERPTRVETLSQLKSLVLAVQHNSVDEIVTVQNHLTHSLDDSQHLLFDYLIQMQS